MTTTEAEMFADLAALHLTTAPVPQPDPYDWCRRRAGEDDDVFRERMLASVPEGLKTNELRECPAAIYMGFRPKGRA